ncbi:MAG: LysE family translocator [Cycloclasticus sp.]
MDALFVFISASFLLALSPGPDNLFVLTQSAQHGKKAGVLITLGLCSGLIFHTVLVAFGLSLIMESSLAIIALKLFGAGYLLYLAFKALTATSKPLRSGPQLAAYALYRRGIIMNISNPKVSLFFLVFLPQFISPDAGSYVYQVFLLSGLFAMTGMTVFFCIAYAGGSLQERLANNPKIQILLNRIAGIIFILLAINLLL